MCDGGLYGLRDVAERVDIVNEEPRNAGYICGLEGVKQNGTDAIVCDILV